jgi:hypothetical protein
VRVDREEKVDCVDWGTRARESMAAWFVAAVEVPLVSSFGVSALGPGGRMGPTAPCCDRSAAGSVWKSLYSSLALTDSRSRALQ